MGGSLSLFFYEASLIWLFYHFCEVAEYNELMYTPNQRRLKRSVILGRCPLMSVLSMLILS